MPKILFDHEIEAMYDQLPRCFRDDAQARIDRMIDMRIRVGRPLSETKIREYSLRQMRQAVMNCPRKLRGKEPV